eukprot:4463520-Amphidinium_carterae.1
MGFDSKAKGKEKKGKAKGKGKKGKSNTKSKTPSTSEAGTSSRLMPMQELLSAKPKLTTMFNLDEMDGEA